MTRSWSRPAGRGPGGVTLRLSPDGRHLVLCNGSNQNTGAMQVWRIDPAGPLAAVHEGISWNHDYTDFSSDGPKFLGYRLINSACSTWKNGPDPNRCHCPLPSGAEGQMPPKGPAGRRRPHGPTARDLWKSRDSDHRGEAKVKFEHNQTCSGLAWHPSGQLLAVGCDDRLIYLWDVDSQRRWAVLKGHQRGASSCVSTPPAIA